MQLYASDMLYFFGTIFKETKIKFLHIKKNLFLFLHFHEENRRLSGPESLEPVLTSRSENDISGPCPAESCQIDPCCAGSGSVLREQRAIGGPVPT
jgi:hypothetical protein